MCVCVCLGDDENLRDFGETMVGGGVDLIGSR